MTKPKKARKFSRFQRAFYEWLVDNRERFSIPILLTKNREGSFSISFSGVNRAISGYLNDTSFSAHVLVKKIDFWDMLISVDVSPMLTPQGYYNEMTLPEYRQFHLTQEALWVAELFEPLVDWVTNDLAPAKCLAMYRWGGVQEACLLRDPALQEPVGLQSFSLLGELRSLDGVAVKDTATPKNTQSWLLPVHAINSASLSEVGCPSKELYRSADRAECNDDSR